MISSRRDPRHASVPFQVPPPPNSRAGVVYNRFIPGEELQGARAWRPAAFTPDDGVASAPAPFDRNTDALTGHWTGNAARPAQAGDAAQAAAQVASAESADAAAQAALLAQWREQLSAEFEADTAQQVAAARTQGYQDGYRDGLAALESFKESFATQVSGQMAAVLQSLDTELAALEQTMAERIARVATELARQVVRSELQQRPALVAQVAREAVNAVLMSASHITVQVHPDDLPLVARGCEEALAARGARLLASPSLQRGGCRVESDAGIIDARIGERWAQATAALGTGLGWQPEAEMAPPAATRPQPKPASPEAAAPGDDTP